MALDNNRKIYISTICIDGKRISAMREIAKATFGESFLFIEVYDGRFIITANDKIDINILNKFKDKYRLCKVRVYQELIDFPALKNERKK